jgi:hypothetical protein
MTLFLAAGGRKYAALTVDRRYTVNGRLADAGADDRQKLITVHVGRLRMAVAFTGLASLGSFRTAYWLAQALHTAIAPDRVLYLGDLRENADSAFNALPTDPASKLLWTVMAGFHQHGEGPSVPTYTILNNESQVASPDGRRQMIAGPFQSQIWEAPETGDAAYAIASGRGRVGAADLERLRVLVSSGAPAHAAVDLSVALIRRAARDPESGGTVGEQCSSAILWADDTRPIEVSYHSTRATRNLIAPLEVTPEGVFEHHFDVDAPALMYGSVHKRSLCPCKSGKRYGLCHGAPGARVRVAF